MGELARVAGPQHILGAIGHAIGQGSGALRIEAEQGFNLGAKLGRNSTFGKKLFALGWDKVG
jgi:hypothetical protein